MQYTDKDTSIITQVAVKAAVDLKAAGQGNGTLIEDARQIRSVIVRLSDEPMYGDVPVVDFAAEIAADPVAVVQEAFPGAQVVDAPPVAAPVPQPVAAAPVAQPAPAGQVSEHPPFDGMTKDKAQKDANSAWAAQRLAVRPDEFWDNRADKANGTKKSTFPDFKHKDSGVGLWLS